MRFSDSVEISRRCDGHVKERSYLKYVCNERDGEESKYCLDIRSENKEKSYSDSTK